MSLPALADDACEVALGHGWPPATENYGSAVEQLLAGGAAPTLMLTRLPARGTEDAVILVRGEDGSWTLRHAEADQRVLVWTGSGASMQRELLVDQRPEVLEVPIPAVLAERFIDAWRRTLAVVPPDRDAPFSEGDTWLLQIEGQRLAGGVPGCGAAEMMVDQVELLIEAADTRESRLDKRWEDLAESLDEMAAERVAGGGNG
ncbi:hypothetical protein [Marilutibacter chinensis]|uniref:SUKH-4 immunity protein of toxin-antitoxin system n=1 Tax=Marilutibacter chinensis TaxID=2912247 RepID=A0ABS9HTR6_9GAMM|nr:hypothetical protein [Lysobacter chinensis]MCF7222294.1 hypothetical protein [Lysobacter chinensis]